MMTQRFGNYDFELVSRIRPERDEVGKILEYSYHLPSGIQSNMYASGPFCRFGLVSASEEPGVYIITVGEEPAYAGECENLGRRFGPNG